MARLVEQVELGRSPADDFSDRVVANGLSAAVLESVARTPGGDS